MAFLNFYASPGPLRSGRAQPVGLPSPVRTVRAVVEGNQSLTFFLRNGRLRVNARTHAQEESQRPAAGPEVIENNFLQRNLLFGSSSFYLEAGQESGLESTPLTWSVLKMSHRLLSLSFASLSSYLIPGALVSLLLGSWAYSGNVRTVFPQIAIGDSVTTTIDLANKGVARFDGYLVVSGNNGYYLPVLIDGHQVLSDYALSVPAGGTLRLELSGTGTATPGHAWVYDNSVSGSIDMDATLDGTATFKIKNGSIQVDAIGVAESGHADHAFVLAEYGPDVDTGLAVSNLSQGNATITLKAKSETGQSLGTGSFVLGPYQHRAAFMHEYMTLSGSFTGTLEIESTQPVFPLALKLQNGQLSALGFCSMPALYDFEVSMKKGTRFRGS